MMKVVTPTGVLRTVTKIEPYAEAGFDLNGVHRRSIELAQDMSVKPTGIKICFYEKHAQFCEPFVYIGNLPPEAVVDIMNTIALTNSYDFSRMEYQKEKPVVDGGASLPYYRESQIGGFALCANTMCNQEYPIAAENDEEGDF